MDTTHLLTAASGDAFSLTLIMFPLVVLAVQHERKAKLGIAQGLGLFVLSVIVCAAANAWVFYFYPSLLASPEQSSLDGLRRFGLPLLVSAITVLALWKPKVSA